MRKSIFLAILFLLTCNLLVSAQAVNPTPTPAPDLSQIKDFRPLFDERERLIDQLARLDQEIVDLSAKVRNLPPVDTLQSDLARATRDLEKEQKLATPDTAKVEAIQRYIDTTNDNLQIAKNNTPLKEKTFEREQQRRRLTYVEQRIASRFDATRDVNFFRAIATIAFSILVLVVVGGFYVIVAKKEGVAAKIFSGEMGMQFVTLFLIVIAIILFGIMGTLEGRELAALLGGLSGYILGKTGLKRDEPSPPKPNEKTNPDPASKPAPDPAVNPNQNLLTE